MSEFASPKAVRPVLKRQMLKDHLGKQRSFLLLVKDKSNLPPQLVNYVNALETALDYAVTARGTRTKEEKFQMKKCLGRIKFLEDLVIRVLVCGEDLDKVMAVKMANGEVPFQPRIRFGFITFSKSIGTPV